MSELQYPNVMCTCDVQGYMYACRDVCLYMLCACVYIHVCVCMAHTHACTCPHIGMDTCTHISVCLHIFMNSRVPVHHTHKNEGAF